MCQKYLIEKETSCFSGSTLIPLSLSEQALKVVASIPDTAKTFAVCFTEDPSDQILSLIFPNDQVIILKTIQDKMQTKLLSFERKLVN